MINKKAFLTVAGVMLGLFLLYRGGIIIAGLYCIFPYWAENIVMHTAIAMLLGGASAVICENGRLNRYSVCIAECGAVFTGILIYILAAVWEEVVMGIEGEGISFLSALSSLAVYIASYLALRTSPRYLNAKVSEGVRMKREPEEEKVGYKETDIISPLIENMKLLRQYEYFDNKGLSLWNGEEKAEKSESERIFQVEYDGMPVGYFQVKMSEREREITEFYASMQIEKSMQILNIALEKYLKSAGKCKVKITDAGLLPESIRYLCEVMVKGYTNACYELSGKESDEDKINYDICFVNRG